MQEAPGALATLPAVGTVLVPSLTCPACWPAYAGLLSSFGLGFVDYTPYLLPLTILFVCLALLSAGYQAEKTRGYLPFTLSVLGAILLLAGRFAMSWSVPTYGGIVLLIAGSIWGSWVPRKGVPDACPACKPAV